MNTDAAERYVPGQGAEHVPRDPQLAVDPRPRRFQEALLPLIEARLNRGARLTRRYTPSLRMSIPRLLSATYTYPSCQYGAHEAASAGRKYAICVGFDGSLTSRNRVPCA